MAATEHQHCDCCDQDDNTKLLNDEQDTSTGPQQSGSGQNSTEDNTGDTKNRIRGPYEEVDHDNYVYIAKFSPLCKCARNCLISYIIIVSITSILLVINVKFCGLDTPLHTITIRNITALTGSYGIICPNYTKTCSFPTYNRSVRDTITNITYNSTKFENQDEDSSIKILGNLTKIQLQVMPMSILINYTKNTEGPRIQKLRGVYFYQPTSLQKIDNGGRISIEVNNTRRKRIMTSSPYFNTGFWLDEYRFNGTTGNESICSQYVSSYDITSINDTKPFIVQSATNNTTQIPVWVINMDSVINATQECCMQNYTIYIAYSSFYCVSPFVIRNMDDINIVFSEVRMVGDYVFDFREDRGFATAYNSSVNRYWLLRYNMTYYVYLSRSQFTFLIPKKNRGSVTFYGVAGNITTTQGQRSISRLEYQISTDMTSQTNITLQIQDNTLDSQLLSTISCALPNCSVVHIVDRSTGSTSTITLERESSDDNYTITLETGQRQIIIKD